MSKLPAFQFYPGDWRKDPAVQALSFHDRGVWFEILCLLHESEDRGKLLLNGHPMPDDALARLIGLDKQVLTKTLTTLLTYGVASRDPKTGALMNRRMVRDEEIREMRRNAGKLGGNPRLLNQNANQNPTTEDKQNPTPSISSSTSVNSPSPAREERLPEWFTPELTEVWREWLVHLAERDSRPTRMTRLTWHQEIQRHGIAEAIEALRFSISKGAKSILWDGPINRGPAAQVVKQEQKPRPKQPPKPSTLFPNGLPPGVKSGW